MTHTIDYWLGDTMVMVLVAVGALGISTALGFFRNLKKKKTESFLFFTLSAFLWVLHLIWIFYAPPESILFHNVPDFWQWLVYMFSPALVTVFLVHAAYWYAKTGGWPALVRIFCGVTLAWILYMLGQDWSISFKAVISIVWIFFLWKVEFPRKPRRASFIYVTRRLL
jgi:hypothetical protein